MLIRLEEAAARLGISYQQLHNLIKEDKLAVVKVGARGIRIDEQEIQRFIQAKREE